MEFEYEHVRTKKCYLNKIVNTDLTTGLERDQKEKEERRKCIREARDNNGS